MEHEKKVSFQLLVLITTPKLAEHAAEMFKKGALPLQYRFNAEGTASLAALTKVFSSAWSRSICPRF